MTPSPQRSRKVVRFMQNEQHLFYSTDECKYRALQFKTPESVLPSLFGSCVYVMSTGQLVAVVFEMTRVTVSNRLTCFKCFPRN